MNSFELANVLAEHSRWDRLYYEFFWAAALSLGLYVLPAGQPDPRGPTPKTRSATWYRVRAWCRRAMKSGP